MAKGQDFERENCKEWSLWWSYGKRDDCFWRTSGSGARATTRRKKGLATSGSCGDMQALDPDGIPLLKVITLEFKRGYGRWSILDPVDKLDNAATQIIEDFIIQARDAAKNAGSLYPVLVCRRDRRKAVIIIPESLYFALVEIGGTTGAENMATFCTDKDPERWAVMTLERFWKWATPEAFKKLSGDQQEAEV